MFSLTQLALTRDSKDLCDPDFKEPKDSQSVQSFFESLTHSLVGATDTGVPWWAEPFQGTRHSTFLSAAEDSVCLFVCCLFFFVFFSTLLETRLVFFSALKISPMSPEPPGIAHTVPRSLARSPSPCFSDAVLVSLQTAVDLCKGIIR